MKTRHRFSLAAAFVILAVSAPPLAIAGQSLKGGPPDVPFAGIWQGSLTLPGGSLRVVFHISAKRDGAYTATLDSPDQGATGIPVDRVSVEKEAISLEIQSLQGSFRGKLESDGSLAGQWSQRGTVLPLTLKRVEKAAEVRRPQEPKAPFPYRAEEVTCPSKPGVTLAGTLTLPQGKGPFPAVLLVAGSGATDRDEAVFGHKPFLVLADYLTRRGVAVLRMDKRGVGKSTGDISKSTDGDYADDALAAVAFLKSRKDVKAKNIGIAGHSEGGLVAARVAATSPDVAFIVLMGAPGLPGDQIILAQQTLILKAYGVGEEEIKVKRALQEKILAVVLQEKDDAKAEAKIRELMKPVIPPGAPEEAVAAQVKGLLSPWYRDFLAYDPRPALQKVKCPVLAVAGEKDLQVPPAENLAAIQGALKAGGNASHAEKNLPGLNHLFQTAQTGSPEEYVKIEETFAPAALQVIGDFIVSQSAAK